MKKIMKIIITSTKEFEADFNLIRQNRKSIDSKLNLIYDYIEKNWIDNNISKFFDIKNIQEKMRFWL